jgi:hypothetical protein
MPAKPSDSYLLCVNNTGYKAALEPRKLYRVLPDVAAKAHGFVRIIDESGEDYLYPASRFAPVSLPQATRRALARAS